MKNLRDFQYHGLVVQYYYNIVIYCKITVTYSNISISL